MSTKTYYVFYSAKAEKLAGSAIHRLKDGREVVGTCVDEDKNNPSYKWKDKQYVGEADENHYVRELVPSTLRDVTSMARPGRYGWDYNSRPVSYFLHGAPVRRR